MNKIIYLNTGSFYIVYFEDKFIDVKQYLSKSIVNWKYIFIPRRIVTFPILFKHIVENQSFGKQYVRIYFYEQRNNPLELIMYFRDNRTIYLLNSNISIYKVLKRIISNPRFSETLVFVAELEDDISNMLSKYERMIKLLNKLYPELSRVVYSRSAGRVLAMELIEDNNLMNLTVCVSQKGVFYKTSIETVNINIKELEQCFTQ